MKAFAALVGFALLASGAWAQSLKEKYELSAQCGMLAAETFRKYWGSGISTSSTGQIIGKYENHYNYRLNKCFYLEISDSYERGKSPFRLMRLYDFQESREIGVFVGTTVFLEEKTAHCSVQEKECKSEEEWRALIKPFMED
jgi:hypothetical protein